MSGHPLMRDLMSNKYIEIKSSDNRSLIKNKLSKNIDYVVLHNRNTRDIRVLPAFVVRKLFASATNTQHFLQIIHTQGVKAIICHPTDRINPEPRKAFASLQNNKIQGVYLQQPGSSSKGTLPTARPTRSLGGIPRNPPFGGSLRPYMDKKYQLGRKTTLPYRSKTSVSKSGEVRATKKQQPFYLNANYQKEVKIKEVLEIKVSISQKQMGDASLPMVVGKNSQIDVIIQSISGFELKGKADGSLIAGGNKEEMVCTFNLLATKIGKGEIRIYAFQDGQSLGHINISVSVIINEAAARRKMARSKQALEVVRNQKADLEMMIMEHKAANGETHIEFRITAANANLQIYLKRFGPVVLKAEPAAYFNDLFKDIEGLNIEALQQKEEAMSKLERIGAALYEEVIPNDLKILLWSIKDQITTIKIDSDEPWIPWEICKLSINEDGTYKEAGFLCELFEITRWIPNHRAPAPTFSFKKWAIVVPSDSGLPYANKEKKSLITLSKAKYELTEVQANYKDIIKNFESGQFSLWHFTGHGSDQDSSNPNNSAMILNNNEKFTPDYIAGKVRNLGLGKPLIFINACQIGKSGVSLTGIGGWAPKFLESGASAFIGAYWSIMDDAAFQFAQIFYKLLISKKYSIGKAVLEARKKIKEKGDPTWLAYSVYADPYAKLI